MKEKEKAKQIHTLMYGSLENGVTWEEAKRCSLIAVDEILKTGTLKERSCGYLTLCESHIEYWEEVKQEIEKL